MVEDEPGRHQDQLYDADRHQAGRRKEDLPIVIDRSMEMDEKHSQDPGKPSRAWTVLT